ncbi:MAG: hypothetical protein IPP83_09245 [Flavobacteriales bacterium]|nr:hypothetical protein [Flavobacteriales bacterium]
MRIRKMTTLLAPAIALGLLLPGCSNTVDEQKAETNAAMAKVQERMDAASARTAATWESERAEMLRDLRQLRDDIDNKLTSSNARLAGKGLKPSERKDEEAMKAELSTEKVKVERLIADVEGANDSTWESVKTSTKKAAEDVKSWWSRLKENVDKKTTRDADHDGH